MNAETGTGVKSTNSGLKVKAYLDRMGPNTREYIVDEMTEGAGKPIEEVEFEMGRFNPETLGLIATLSQVDDDLGLHYARTAVIGPFDCVYTRVLTPEFVKKALKKPDQFKVFLKSINEDDIVKLLDDYAKSLGLTD